MVEHLPPTQASHQCGPGSIRFGVIRGLSLLLVLVLAPRGFSPGTQVFPSPQKPTFPNSNFDLEFQDLPENHYGEWSLLTKYYYYYLNSKVNLDVDHLHSTVLPLLFPTYN